MKHTDTWTRRTREAGDRGQEPAVPAAFPLVHTQRAIWTGQRLHPDSPLYNMAFAFVLPATLQPEVFCTAWQAVADASDALRTRVVEDETGDARWTVTPVGRATERQTLDSSDEFFDWCRRRCARPLAPVAVGMGDLVDSVLVTLPDGRYGWYLNQHHVIADAWSTVLLFRQVSAAYDASLCGEAGWRPQLPAYYPTIQALPPGSSSRTAALEHWASRRRRPGRAVTLYGRSVVPSGSASTRLTLTIDERRARAFENRCREMCPTGLSETVSRFGLFSMLCSAWLHRIGGPQELEFDAPVSGRTTAAARQALGMFVEIFPLTVAVRPEDTFETLAHRCLDETTTLLRYALPGTSSPSMTTASKVVLNYVPASFGDFAGMPVVLEWVHSGHGDSVHALRVQLHEFQAPGRYVLHFDFNDAALEDRLRRRSLEHFMSVFDAFLENPDRLIAGVDILTADERYDLAALNDSDRTPLPARSVVAMFEATSGAHPTRVALRQQGVELTFGELREQVNAVAAALTTCGVQRGDRVAILGRRSIPVVTAIAAALRAGAAYVPLDPAWPPARHADVLADSGARVLLTGDLDSTHSGVDVPVLRVGDIVRASQGATPTSPLPDLADLAYLIYTSGSTGQPKGVPIDHAGLADYLGWAERRYVRGDCLTYPLFTSLAFDLTVTSLFLPLITGGTLEIYPEPEGSVDSAIVDVIQANAVDFIKLTPSHLSLVRRLGVERSRLRRLVVGGEDFKTALASAIYAQLPGQAEIFNEYGPTEAVVGCIAHRYVPEADTGASVPIGAPADHVHVEILNQSLSPVPEGVPGELWLSRYGLSRGYHRRETLTAERFQPHPERAGERRYRTGDLVRLLDGRTLEYLGRIDRQVKIAGVRVEPGEVEAQLLAMPEVDQCAVVARRRPRPSTIAGQHSQRCVRCGLSSDYPRTSVDEAGVCSICRSFDTIREPAQAYFKTTEDLWALFSEHRRTRQPAYDCLMLYSGGKDSTYALCRLVEAGLSVRAFTLDNGFISASAKENIRRVGSELGVPIEMAAPPGMDAIFRDSLSRFSNVCNGCFKTIYSMGMLRARELRIPVVVTGLSRGQMFETRLSPDLFRNGRGAAEEIDAAVLAARKAYHRTPDVVSRVIDTRPFLSDEIFEDVQVVDFYRYCDVGMDEMLSYLARTVPWVRPADTGRSTNCLINDVGIYVHRLERGFHNYALPYSWDVRLGHKTREEALQELDDEIDPERVRSLLAQIGYDESLIAGDTDTIGLVAFYVTSKTVTDDDIRRHLADRVPAHLVPSQFQRVDSIPLTINGKVDEAALTGIVAESGFGRPEFVAPAGQVAEFLARVWEEELGVESVGATDGFFALGGTSLAAMQVIVRVCRNYGIDVPLATIFKHPSLAGLTRVVEDLILADVDAGDSGHSGARA